MSAKDLFYKMKTKKEFEIYLNKMQDEDLIKEDILKYDRILKENKKLVEYLKIKNQETRKRARSKRDSSIRKGKEVKKTMVLKNGVPYKLNDKGKPIVTASTKAFEI